MSVTSLRIARIIAGLRRVAPYLAIELIVPGGSMVALILWLLRTRARRGVDSRGDSSALIAGGIHLRLPRAAGATDSAAGASLI